MSQTIRQDLQFVWGALQRAFPETPMQPCQSTRKLRPRKKGLPAKAS